MAIINFNNSVKSYTASLLKLFSNMQLKIDSDTNLYQIPIVFSSASRLYKELAKKDDSFTYRVPIMSLSIDIDTSTGFGERAISSVLKRKVIETENDSLLVTYSDKPLDLLGTITLIADTATTLTNLIEYINSMFYNNVIYFDYKSPLGENIRTPIKLENIEINMNNEEDVYEGNRYLEATIGLRVEGVSHSQISTNSKKITHIDFILEDYYKGIENIIDSYEIK